VEWQFKDVLWFIAATFLSWTRQLVSIESLMMTIYRVPKIELDTGTDWTAVWTAVGTSLATITVVLITTLYTAYSFRKTIKAQKELADAQEASRIAHSKAEAVARSRQDWINSLRDEVALFIATGDELAAASGKLRDKTPPTPQTPEDVQRSKDLYSQRYSDFARSLMTAKLHYSRVQLYTNPTEKETDELLGAMNAYIQASVNCEPTADLGGVVVRVTQTIIKNEWRRVKAMK
jgi:type II secretory pathway pseudopilin PulG